MVSLVRGVLCSLTIHIHMNWGYLNLASLQARRGLVSAVLCLGLFPAAAAPGKPPGTPVEARLLTPLSSYTARPGTQVEAMLATPVCPSGEDPLSVGAILRGSVVKVRRVGLGLLYETATIRLDFRELSFPGGRVYPIQSQLTGIDNAREHVDGSGAIRGIRATSAISNRVGERLAFLAMGHPAAMLPLFAIENSMFHFPDPEIELQRGADLRLAVEFPPEFGPVSPCAVPEELSDREWTALHSLVNGLPYWTYSQRQRQPLDLVNLVYVGSRVEMSRAFTAAGWIGSRPHSMRAGMSVMRAIAENHALPNAPMRTLLLDGAPPDLELQKSLDTFEKRDHLRIWARPEILDGREVWASAATRDMAAVFSAHPFGFTHQIQDDVDLERDQVVSDLAFTGCVDSVAYVARPETIRTSGESYRKGIFTDSRVAVVSLNSCETPREDLSQAGQIARPGKLVRWIRRVTLTARNHFLRDNLVWRTGDGIHLAFRTVRGWRQEHENERHARALDAKLAARPDLRADFAVSQR